MNLIGSNAKKTSTPVKNKVRVSRSVESKSGSSVIRTKPVVEKPAEKKEERVQKMPAPVAKTPMTAKGGSSSSMASNQQPCDGCEKERMQIQKKPQANGTAAAAVAPAVGSKITSTQGSGKPLDGGTQAFMGSRMGQDFGHVNIHNDATSHDLSNSLGAKAFTVGSDIYFNRGEYNPQSAEGKRLLAHELTHVVQQGGHEEVMGNEMVQRDAISDARDFVTSAIDFLNNSAQFYAVATINQATLDRVLDSWFTMVNTNVGLIQNTIQDPALLQTFQTAYKNVLSVFLTRAVGFLSGTSVIQLYLSNLHRIPDWARPNVASFNLANEAQKRTFITNLTNAFNVTSLFQNYGTIDLAAFQSILTYLQSLITDSQNMIADQLGNDPALLAPLKSAYRTAVDQLLSRASLVTGTSVSDLFLQFRYGPTHLIHEWADQELAGISAAVPLGVSPDPITGNISVTVNGMNVTILQDGSQTDSGAATNITMAGRPALNRSWDGSGHITTFDSPPTPSFTIQTNYGPSSSQSVSSGYGRGTTAEDQRLGNTTLGYHEKTHSRDYLGFLMNNSPATFTGAAGITRNAFNNAETLYDQQMSAYNTRMARESELATDCVGSPNIVQFHANNGTTTTVTCP